MIFFHKIARMFALVILLFAFSFSMSQAQEIELFALDNKDYVFVHVIAEQKGTGEAIIKKGEKMGDLEEMPDKYSNIFNDKILEATDLYKAKKYKDSAKILEEVYKKEPENQFVMNEYARALYWVDNEKSFEIYTKLVKSLDSYKGKNYVKIKPVKKTFEDKGLKKEVDEITNEISERGIKEVVIDLWFQEAYWKIGTLHFDVDKDLLMVVYNISRSMAMLDVKDISISFLVEQQLSYLTEAYFYLKKHKIAMYYAEETLKLNPDNKYVLPYMEKIRESNKSQ